MKRYSFWECWSRRGELSAFESGELTPERAERVASHLAVCSRCRNEWESLSGVASLLRAEPPVAALPAADLWSRIESKILEPIPAPAPSPAWRRPAFALSLSGAAMAAIAAVVVPKFIAPSSVATPSPRLAVEASAHAPTPSPDAVATVDLARNDAPPVIYAQPTPEPTPRPAPVRRSSAPRRSRSAGRVDPFEPMAVTSHARRRPTRRVSPPPAPLVAIAQPSDNAPNAPDAISVNSTGEAPAMDTAAKKAAPATGETVIAVTKPSAAKMAFRDARTEGESAESRAAAAMESPLDAVERASRARRLFP